MPKAKAEIGDFGTANKDVLLLRSALQHNPWQLGDKKWKNVVGELADSFEIQLTVTTVKGRITLLIEKLKSQQLETSTGTEEEITERGVLLQEIDAIIENEKASINTSVGADNSEYQENFDPNLPVFDEEEVVNAKKSICNKARKVERVIADLERDRLIDEAPEYKKNRPRLSLEDRMIEKRQEHKMDMEAKKLELEKDHLELEKQREERLRLEGLRRDEISKSQMDIQGQMLQLMNKFLEK